MGIRDIAAFPFQALAVLSSAKSFSGNKVLASPALNRIGLHRMRVELAERMADSRRRWLRNLISEEQRERFDAQGFIQIDNVLHDDLFAEVTKELESTRFASRELKQGNTVTRFITLSPKTLRRTPALAAATRAPEFQGLLRYAGSRNSDPLVTLHTVLTKVGNGQTDPQTHFHSDTFHTTAKAWLFLRDVTEEDGPFSYVPASHRMTPERLEWEQRQSLSAAHHADPHHAAGSFRATRSELAEMGYEPAVPLIVKANTLVVADTHGFHARQPSRRPSVRIALYGSVRGNPFNPFVGPDIMDLPGLRGRRAQLLDLARAAEARLFRRREVQPYVGDLFADDPPVL